MERDQKRKAPSRLRRIGDGNMAEAGASSSGAGNTDGLNPAGGVDDDDDDPSKNHGGHGRRKIEIEYIKDKIRRHITFSKRKAGISKKAYELSRLTGAQAIGTPSISPCRPLLP